VLSQQKTLRARYQYDALDRLTLHGSSERLESQRFYCEGRLATELQGAEWHSIVQYGDYSLAQQELIRGQLNAVLLAADLQESVLSIAKGKKNG